MLSVLESVIRDRYEEFVKSDKSVASLKAVEIYRAEALQTVRRILNTGCSVVSQRINGKLDWHIDQFKSDAKTFYFFRFGDYDSDWFVAVGFCIEGTK